MMMCESLSWHQYVVEGWDAVDARPREIVFQSGSDPYLKNIYDLRIRELNDDSPLDSYVFCHKDGKPIGRLKKGSITVGSFGVT